MLAAWIHAAVEQLSAIGLFYWLKWLVAVAMVAAIGRLHHYEHQRLRQLLKAPQPRDRAEGILSLFTSRSVHLLALLALCVLGVILHDVRSIRLSLISASMQAAAPEPVAATTPPLPPAPLFQSNLPFGDITVLTEKDADAQAYLDLIKQRYEKLLVTYFYLSQCKLAVPEDFALLQLSLRADLQNAKAPLQTAANILQAAKGTYSEIYAYSPCQGEGIAVVKQSFDDSLAQLRQRPPGVNN